MGSYLTVGLPELISSNPLNSFLVVVFVVSLLVLLMHSVRKTKLKAVPWLLGSGFALAALYNESFRTALVIQLGISSSRGDQLAIGIQQAGANALLWTPEMTAASIVGFGAAVVAWGTGSRKLSGLMAAITAGYLIAKAWAIISPILIALL